MTTSENTGGIESRMVNGDTCCGWLADGFWNGASFDDEKALEAAKLKELELRALCDRSPVVADILSAVDVATPARATALSLLTFISSIVEAGGRIEIDSGTGEDSNAIECVAHLRGRKPAVFVGVSRPRAGRLARTANVRDAIQDGFKSLVQGRESPLREPAKRLPQLAELLADFALANPERALSECTAVEFAEWVGRAGR